MRRAAKPIVFLLALAPAVALAYTTVYLPERLGANPVETLELTTGLWAFRFLLLSLAITPVRRVTGWNRLIQYRRMLGLFAFFYATLHVVIYVVLDQGLAMQYILADIAKRRFITAGLVAFVCLIPLALTSTQAAIRALGRRWQTLHRLVYLSAAAAALHFVWKVKVVIGEPVYYAAILAVLLLFRVVWHFRPAPPARRQPIRA